MSTTATKMVAGKTTSEAFDLFGKTAKDKVTGFEGVVVSLWFDLSGCIQAALSPPATDEKGLAKAMAFDIQRLEVTDHTRKLAAPNFLSMETPARDYSHGSAERPEYTRYDGVAY